MDNLIEFLESIDEDKLLSDVMSYKYIESKIVESDDYLVLLNNYYYQAIRIQVLDVMIDNIELLNTLRFTDMHNKVKNMLVIAYKNKYRKEFENELNEYKEKINGNIDIDYLFEQYNKKYSFKYKINDIEYEINNILLDVLVENLKLLTDKDKVYDIIEQVKFKIFNIKAPKILKSGNSFIQNINKYKLSKPFKSLSELLNALGCIKCNNYTSLIKIKKNISIIEILTNKNNEISYDTEMLLDKTNKFNSAAGINIQFIEKVNTIKSDSHNTNYVSNIKSFKLINGVNDKFLMIYINDKKYYYLLMDDNMFINKKDVIFINKSNPVIDAFNRNFNSQINDIISTENMLGKYNKKISTTFEKENKFDILDIRNELMNKLPKIKTKMKKNDFDSKLNLILDEIMHMTYNYISSLIQIKNDEIYISYIAHYNNISYKLKKDISDMMQRGEEEFEVVIMNNKNIIKEIYDLILFKFYINN